MSRFPSWISKQICICYTCKKKTIRFIFFKLLLLTLLHFSLNIYQHQTISCSSPVWVIFTLSFAAIWFQSSSDKTPLKPGRPGWSPFQSLKLRTVVLDKIPIFWKRFVFFDQNLFLTKISIFGQNSNLLLPKFRAFFYILAF